MKPKKPMRGVVWRDGGWWFNRTVNGVRKWENLGTRIASEAVAKALDIRDNPLKDSVDGLAGSAARFIQYKQDRGLFTARSAEKAKFVLADFAKHCGARTTVRNATEIQCRNWYEEQRSRLVKNTKRQVTESSAQTYMLVLRSFFRWAVEVERARLDNPVAKVKMAKFAARGRQRHCTKEQKNTLIAAAKNDDMRFILYCGFDAGLRRNEISEARADWFDLTAGLLHIRRTPTFTAKDKEERTIELTVPFRSFLADYLKGRESSDFALRPKVEKGKFRYRYDFRRPFTEFMIEQKMAWVTPHVMRHSFASILASAGVSIYKIALWMGDDVRVVQRHYAKLAPGDVDIHKLTS